MTSTGETRQLIRNLEGHLLKAEVRSSEAELEKYLADDFIEFGTSGKVWDKSSIIADIAEEQFSTDKIILEASDFSETFIAEDAVFLTYLCQRKNQHGKILRTTIRSSIWRLYGNDWKLYFNQGTIVND